MIGHRLHSRLTSQGQRFHRQEGGAIILLVLAGMLILVLTSLILYDAGQTAHQKMRLQNAADVSAYSQAAVKARSMNLIAYANTIKRSFFGYFVTYQAAWAALGISEGIYCGQCASSYGTNVYACYRCTIGGIQIGFEAAQMVVSIRANADRAIDEMETLAHFQQYLYDITPWWGYAENILRGTYAGATMTTAWPPPEATPPAWVESLINIVMAFDNIFGTQFGNFIPGVSDRFDNLPIEQRDSSADELLGYCEEMIGSLELILPAVEHIANSDGGGWDPMGISADNQTIGIFIGLMLVPPTCITAGSTPSILGGVSGGRSALMDWRVDEGGFMPGSRDENDWMLATSNITFAYLNTNRSEERALRNYDGLVDADHIESAGYESDGTWSIARSEIAFGESVYTSGHSMLSNLAGFASSMTSGAITALRGPNMWHPRWTPRLRPVFLPGETLGGTIQGGDAGLGAAFLRSLPHLIMSTAVSQLVTGNFNIQTAVGDMFYMFAATRPFDTSNLTGFVK